MVGTGTGIKDQLPKNKDQPTRAVRIALDHVAVGAHEHVRLGCRLTGRENTVD